MRGTVRTGFQPDHGSHVHYKSAGGVAGDCPSDLIARRSWLDKWHIHLEDNMSGLRFNCVDHQLLCVAIDDDANFSHPTSEAVLPEYFNINTVVKFSTVFDADPDHAYITATNTAGVQRKVQIPTALYTDLSKKVYVMLYTKIPPAVAQIHGSVPKWDGRALIRALRSAEKNSLVTSDIEDLRHRRDSIRLNKVSDWMTVRTTLTTLRTEWQSAVDLGTVNVEDSMSDDAWKTFIKKISNPVLPLLDVFIDSVNNENLSFEQIIQQGNVIAKSQLLTLQNSINNDNTSLYNNKPDRNYNNSRSTWDKSRAPYSRNNSNNSTDNWPKPGDGKGKGKGGYNNWQGYNGGRGYAPWNYNHYYNDPQYEQFLHTYHQPPHHLHPFINNPAMSLFAAEQQQAASHQLQQQLLRTGASSAASSSSAAAVQPPVSTTAPASTTSSSTSVPTSHQAALQMLMGASHTLPASFQGETWENEHGDHYNWEHEGGHDESEHWEGDGNGPAGDGADEWHQQ